MAAHATHDVLGEGDPDLLVVLEAGMGPEIGERGQAGVLVAIRVESEPVRLPYAPIGVRTELRPGAREREVDVEEDCAEHTARIGIDAARLPPRAATL
jgi:hypothetical protein